ncbi:hypothetical protein BH18GEM1_BH18GEM1_05730 [soil metagenome]
MRVGTVSRLIVLSTALACQETETDLSETTEGEVEEIDAIEEIDEAAGVDEPQRVVIEARSFAYQPSAITVATGRPVWFVVTNAADTAHGFEVEGHGMEEEIESIAPGGVDSLGVTFDEPGDYTIYCPVDDHQQRGMTGTLTAVE